MYALEKKREKESKKCGVTRYLCVTITHILSTVAIPLIQSICFIHCALGKKSNEK